MANKRNAQVTTFNTLKPIKDTILVYGMDFNERITNSGIILPDDDMKSAGIRPRWAKVYKTGPEVTDVKEGQYIMIAHGRWSRGQTIEDTDGEKTIRKVDPNDILLVSDEPVEDFTMSDKI